MVYDELLTTTKYLENRLLMDGIDGDGAGMWTEGLETTTVGGPTEQSRVLGLYDIFIPLLGVFIIVLNSAVVISSGLILKKGQQPRSTYLFLGNVALTDLLTGVSVLFGQFYPKAYRGEMSCAIQIGMIVSATVTSVYSVLLIAVDRFLYILYGLQYQRWVYPNRARLLILITWIIGIVVGFLPAFGWRGDTGEGRWCWFIRLAPPELILLTSCIGFLPIIIVVILYSIILHHALRKVIQLKRAARNNGAVSGNLRIHVGTKSTTMPMPSHGTAARNSSVGGSTGGAAVAKDLGHNNRGGDGGALSETEEPLQPRERSKGIFNFLSRRKRETTTTADNGAVSGFPPPPPQPARSNKSLTKWKAVKVVLFTSGSFVVTWVPYFIACCMYVACNWDETADRCRSIQFAIASPLAILGFANSLTNPIIYAWWHNGFRESAKAIFCGAACRKKRPSESDGPTMSTGRTSASGGGGGRGRGASSENGNSRGGRLGVSSTTLDASATDDVDHTDVDGSVSDAESALRCRVVDAPEEQLQQRRQPINGDSTVAARVCYQPDTTTGAVGVDFVADHH